jgi:hypothetical protein
LCFWNWEHVWRLFCKDETFFGGSVEHQFFLECTALSVSSCEPTCEPPKPYQFLNRLDIDIVTVVKDEILARSGLSHLVNPKNLENITVEQLNTLKGSEKNNGMYTYRSACWIKFLFTVGAHLIEWLSCDTDCQIIANSSSRYPAVATQAKRYGPYTAVYSDNTASHTVLPYYCARYCDQTRSFYGAVWTKFTVEIRTTVSIDLEMHDSMKSKMIGSELIHAAKYQVLRDLNIGHFRIMKHHLVLCSKLRGLPMLGTTSTSMTGIVFLSSPNFKLHYFSVLQRVTYVTPKDVFALTIWYARKCLSTCLVKNVVALLLPFVTTLSFTSIRPVFLGSKAISYIDSFCS